MKEELLPFTEDTLSDADSITHRMFGLSCLPILKRILANPLRKKMREAAGEVAYQDGELMGFQAAIVRRLYWNGKPLLGIVGSTLCMRSDASPVLLMHLMKATIAPRMGSRIFFANTSNPKSMKMNRMLGIKGAGPSSCSEICFAVTYWPKFLKWMLPAPRARQIKAIDKLEIDVFWEKYLTTSKGLVSSRTGDELAWAFGEPLEDGKVVMLCDYEDTALQGYIVFSYSHGGTRAMIVDWVALRDDPSVLKSLIYSALLFLRKYANTILFESIGFNNNAQAILKKALPFHRRTANNTFIYQIMDKELENTVTPDLSKDWFFGPYDGDRCMG